MNMKDDLLYRFCQHPRRWAIVITVTSLVGLAILLPHADHYSALATEQAELTEQLDEASRVAGELPKYEQLLASKREQLAAIEARTVPQSNVATLRKEIVDLVRKSDCQVLRFNVGEAQQRAWREGDSPLPDSIDVAPSPGAATGFVLETRPVAVTVSGSTAAVRSFLTTVEQQGKLLYPKLLDLRPTGSSRKSVELTIELWYFALERVGKV
ncbi:hypothetical protein Pla175_33140 [Pirellulimonas nuda]|uniref:Pilus assembly protein, PilO n=1 Tax=Pirellulimonas nuda TaxID=2528009 RepID=A0A518DEM2_9BACT|nr:hypothetical protein [Pirellulimonas nuda]QDU89917.1 hypothetical protein Pla175_33140 [Pirellulimonas nuda]